MHILIVDDDDLVRRTFVRSFRALGHTVSAAQSVADALREVGSASLDVVLLDLQMPRSDVFDSLRALVQVAPTFILTGDPKTSLKPALLAAGACDVLGKPISPRELHARLESAVGLRRHV